MGDYLYINNGTTIPFDSDTLPCLDGNARGEHLVKIAAAYEDAGIDGVRVECIKESDDRFLVVLHLKQDSLAERILNTIAEEGAKTNRIPSIVLALHIAKHVQKLEGGCHE